MSVHAIPENDEKPHDLEMDCACSPRVVWIDPDTNLPYPNGPMVIHNSYDCREIAERIDGIGIPGKPWNAVEV